MEHSTQGSQSSGGPVDPVCGMTVEPGPDTPTFQHGGRLYGFCSPHCLERFRSDPAAYVAAKLETVPAEKPARSRSVIYTCPMHPEIRQVGPGPCPKCGMALEPLAGALAEETNPELADMTRRCVVSALLSAPVLFLAMSDLLPGVPIQRLLSGRAVAWIQLALATPAVLWG